jgi:hypothetical protein
LLSVLDQCVAATIAVLRQLNLPSANPGAVPSPSSNIIDQLTDDDPKKPTMPCIILTTDKATPTDEKALNGTDDWGNGIRILVKDVCMQFDSQRRSLYRGWLQSIRRAFHNQRLPGVSYPSGNSIINKIELRGTTPVSDKAPQVVLDLLLRAITREPRGLGA